MILYSYTYDKSSGGLLLNTTPTGFSKEPRPVYSTELDILGFDKYWNYEKQDHTPYMWAEANNYWYRGVHVAKLKGGNIYTAPEIIIPEDEKGYPVQPEAKDKALRPIDVNAMINANKEMLEIIVQSTVKKILAVYEKYKDKLDLFHVAYSGGKDSAVLLDLVKKALPKGSFVVVFGDTGMEFPDTYDIVEKTKRECKQEGIPFFISKSHMEPKQSWELFGPPSRALRWCCSVHKSTPQTLKLREISSKENYKGLDFVGVRSSESINRSKYTYEGYGKKQKGQYSHNSILEWTSAEIWIYMYSNNLPMNNAYKKGNNRAGCLYCPMSGGTSDYIRYINYSSEIDEYIEIIKNRYNSTEPAEKSLETYVFNGGWNARNNGRDLKNNPSKYYEGVSDGLVSISIHQPSSNWLEWMKTIGDLKELAGKYQVHYNDLLVEFSVKNTKCGYKVSISEHFFKKDPYFGKIFKQVFQKAAYCNGCGVCEANCVQGCISFENNDIKIRNCTRCHACHSISSGCLIFHSLRQPKGGRDKMKSLNTFADHAPKSEWLESFFVLKSAFFNEHTLGPMMYNMFRRFLKDAQLQHKNQLTSFAELISEIGWKNDVSQGLILINLAYNNPQIEWYINQLELDVFYTRTFVENMLSSLDVKPKDAKSICKAYHRLVETPLGLNLHFGYVTDQGELVRTKCNVSDPRVVLYGLYKFAEKCNDYKEFTLSTLLNDNIERDGISPTRIFGLDREEMTPILLGLSAKYPEFITASFTHDLEKITLADDKNSKDVLDLFREGM